jgi:hypothetical protein
MQPEHVVRQLVMVRQRLLLVRENSQNRFLVFIEQRVRNLPCFGGAK